MIPIGPFRVVPVAHCLACGVDMPADHECLGPDVEAFIRAVQDDYRRYGSPKHLDTP